VGFLLSDIRQDGITIGTVSGGIVNFGGAFYICPISITKTVGGGGSGNTEEDLSASFGANEAGNFPPGGFEQAANTNSSQDINTNTQAP